MEGLQSIKGIVTNILSNPVDLNLGGAGVEVVQRAMRLVTSDPNIDVVIVVEHVTAVLSYVSGETAEAMNEVFMECGKERGKPIILVLPPGLAELERAAAERSFRQAGIPVYSSVERAARAVANLVRYSSFRHNAKEEDLGRGFRERMKKE